MGRRSSSSTAGPDREATEVWGVFEQGADLGVGQIRDIGEVCWGCLGEALGGGEAVDEFEDPSGGEVFLVHRASSGKVRASRWWNWLIRRVR